MRNCAVFTLALLAALVGRPSQAQSSSPLQAVKPLLPYADGRATQNRYVFGDGRKLLSDQDGADAFALGMESAKGLAAGLPAGYSLGESRTARFAVTTGPQALSFAEDPQSSRTVTLHPLLYRGVPLMRGGDVASVVAGDGQVIASRTRMMPAQVDGIEPTVRPEAAAAEVRHQLAMLARGRDLTLEPPHLEIWVGSGDAAQLGRLAWAIVAHDPATPADPLAVRFWIAARGQPTLLQSEGLIMHGQQGTATASMWGVSPLRATVNAPLDQLQVNRNAGGGGGLTISDVNGHYTFSGLGAAVTLTAGLSGPWASVQNQATGSVNLTAQGNASGNGTLTINLAFAPTDEAGLAQTTALHGVNQAHRFAQSILAGTALANLPVRTSLNQNCNAFYSPVQHNLNFFHAGGGCVNSAYLDVIAHEFGHAVDDANGGIVDGGYSEGFGDAMTLLITRQHCVGRDFQGAGTCLRDTSQVKTWPPAANSDVHDIGWRYSGFVWELITRLRASHPVDEAYQIAANLILGAAAMNPSSVPDAVHASFVIDDDDGNLATCSPHFQELAGAADSRQIPRPANCQPKDSPQRTACLQQCAADRADCLAGHTSRGGGPTPAACVQAFKRCTLACPKH